ncbi:MAG TPA: hypothetical protein VM468_09660, partial [Mycoplana sp.]|nr:hypothetical protein [Mycoplana sp.]
GMSDLILPRPSQVAVTLVQRFPILWPHILQTLGTTMLGFALGVLLVTHDLREAGFLASRICVMSARPGRIIDDSAVAFARPRSIAMTFEPDFVALNQRLRDLIVDARSAPAPEEGT